MTTPNTPAILLLFVAWAGCTGNSSSFSQNGPAASPKSATAEENSDHQVVTQPHAAGSERDGSKNGNRPGQGDTTTKTTMDSSDPAKPLQGRTADTPSTTSGDSDASANSPANETPAAATQEHPPHVANADVLAVLAKARKAAEQSEYAKGQLFLQIARIHQEIGNREACCSCLEQAMTAAKADSGFSTQPTVLAGIAEVQRKLGDSTGHKTTLSFMKKCLEDYLPSIRSKYHLLLAREYAQLGDRTEYKLHMKAALDGLKAAEGPRVVELVAETVKTMAIAGEYDLALQCANLVDDQVGVCHAIFQVSLAQARAGKHDDALRTIRAIPRLDYRIVYLVTLAQTEAESGQIASARDTYQALSVFDDFNPEKAKVLRARVLISISHAEARKGDREAALRTSAEAGAFVRDLKPKDVDPNWLATIAEAHAASGHRDLYLTAIADAEKSLTGFDDFGRDELIGAVVQARVMAGDLAQAIRLAEQDKHAPNRVTAFLAIARALRQLLQVNH